MYYDYKIGDYVAWFDITNSDDTRKGIKITVLRGEIEKIFHTEPVMSFATGKMEANDRFECRLLDSENKMSITYDEVDKKETKKLNREMKLKKLLDET